MLTATFHEPAFQTVSSISTDHNRHKLCILQITFFAYDYLFNQQRNSHDEYLVNENLLKGHLKWKKHLQLRGRHDHYPSSGAVKSRFRESLKCQIARGKSPPESPGALGMNSSNESCMIKHLLVVRRHNATDSDNSLHSESVDIVEKKYYT